MTFKRQFEWCVQLPWSGFSSLDMGGGTSAGGPSVNGGAL